NSCAESISGSLNNKEKDDSNFKIGETTVSSKIGIFSLECDEEEQCDSIPKSKSGLISDISMKEHMAQIEIDPLISHKYLFKNQISRDLDSRIDEFENA
ncbi:hypothetical protein MXB_2755, partial [Myxobolus squamalis]